MYYCHFWKDAPIILHTDRDAVLPRYPIVYKDPYTWKIVIVSAAGVEVCQQVKNVAHLGLMFHTQEGSERRRLIRAVHTHFRGVDWTKEKPWGVDGFNYDSGACTAKIRRPRVLSAVALGRRVLQWR